MRYILFLIFYMTFNLLAYGECLVPQNLKNLSKLLSENLKPTDQKLICRLDNEVCREDSKSVLTLLNYGVNATEMCKTSNGVPLLTAIDSQNKKIVAEILKRKNLNLNREFEYGVGVGTPPFTALAMARIRAGLGTIQSNKILALIKSAGARFENCGAVVQLNDPDKSGSHLRAQPNSTAKIQETVAFNPKTLFIITGHQEGWLRVSKVLPEGAPRIQQMDFSTAKIFKTPVWIYAKLTRYPDILLEGRAEPGTYTVRSCVTENVEVVDSNGKVRWFGTSNLATYL